MNEKTMTWVSYWRILQLLYVPVEVSLEELRGKKHWAIKLPLNCSAQKMPQKLLEKDKTKRAV